MIRIHPSSQPSALRACGTRPAPAFEHAGQPGHAFAGACVPHEAFIWAQAEVIKAACVLEPDVDAVLDWFAGDPIEALGGRTAANLVAIGMAQPVLDFLAAAIRDAGEADRARRLRAEALA
jgi:hypothetical protein